MKIKKLFMIQLWISFALHVSAQPVYNYYFGNIHAHSSYSDGNKDSATSLMSTPLQDFNYAKSSQHIDFYGIAEHNHSSAGMRSPVDYHRGLADANVANQDGTFVALYGMEWGIISGGGHVIIYGYDSLMGWDPGDYDVYVAQHDYTGLWNKINAKPGAFAYLAHPQSSDYNDLFTTARSPEADSAIVGMAMRSGPAFSTNTSYSDPGSGTYSARYQDALKRGYHVGIGLDHDTHYSVFGRQSAGRLVVLATSLTKVNILDAIKRMRFYSSDDWNVKVNFSISSQPMGSIITHSGSPTLSVTVTDPDGEGVSSIKVYSGIPGSGTAPTILTSNTGSASLTYTHAIANNSQYYYYLMITQADGDVIWTSPIWYKRDDAASSLPVASFSTSGQAVCVGQPVTLLDYSSNAPSSWSWSMPGGTPSSSSLQNPVVTYSTPGSHSISLIATNTSGSSTSISNNIMVTSIPVVNATSATICSGQGGSISASGAAAYSWNNGSSGATISVNPSIVTTYTVTGTVSGCSSSATATVNVNPSPSTPTISLSGDTLTSSSAVNNQWYLNGTLISGATSQQFIAGSSGSYSVTVTSGNGCFSVSPSVNYSVIGIDEINLNEVVNIFPNPSTGLLNIDLAKDSQHYVLKVYNCLGEIIVSKEIIGCSGNCNQIIDLSRYENGLYLLKISDDKSSVTRRIILNK